LLLLHGPHQLAQKSISTTLPFNEERVTIFPFMSAKDISGAGSFIFGWLKTYAAESEKKNSKNRIFICSNPFL